MSGGGEGIVDPPPIYKYSSSEEEQSKELVLSKLR
jgi:hypothetical protein